MGRKKTLTKQLKSAEKLVGSILEDAEDIIEEHFPEVQDKVGKRVVKLSVAQMIMTSLEILLGVDESESG